MAFPFLGCSFLRTTNIVREKRNAFFVLVAAMLLCGAGNFACRRLSGGALVAAMLLSAAGGFACLARLRAVFPQHLSNRRW